jgi:LacI family transcriptional regulator
MSRSPVTLEQVARLAGVSKVTVSKTLNNTGRISHPTRERVLKAVADLGYVANTAARSLRGRRSNILGLTVPELISPYFAEVARAAAEVASLQGYDLALFTTSRDPVRERERVHTLLGGLADGLIVVVPSTSPEFLATLERSPAPVVLINHFGAVTHLPTVRADSYMGSAAAVRHLLELGHRRVGFVSGAANSSQAKERLRAYREVMVAADLFDPDLIAQGDFTQPGGFRAGQQLLQHSERPSAIFAASDVTAFGVLDAARSLGLSVPQQLSLVGFDDVPTASQIVPPLTTVRHPIHQMAEIAIGLLLDSLSGKTTQDRLVELPSELIVRASSGRPGG